jgi:hypothetical protein
MRLLHSTTAIACWLRMFFRFLDVCEHCVWSRVGYPEGADAAETVLRELCDVLPLYTPHI